MDILKKKDYDKCERSGFRLYQKVLFTNDKKETVKSRILAIDTTYSDNFGFFVRDEKGDYCKSLSGCGTKEVFNKKGTWCRKEDIAPIADESVPFNIENHTQKALSLCTETNDDKAKYFKYKNRVVFVKAIEDTELGFSDESRLVEIEKEADAEAVVILFYEDAYEMKRLYNTIIALNLY